MSPRGRPEPSAPAAAPAAPVAPAPAPLGPLGTLVRAVIAIHALAFAIAFPGVFGGASLEASGLGPWGLFKAALWSLLAGLLLAALSKRIVRDVWVGWLGVLAGGRPHSQAGARGRQLAIVAAYLAAGVLGAWVGTRLYAYGRDGHNVVLTFWGLVQLLVAGVVAVAGSLPRVVLAARPDRTSQPEAGAAGVVWLFLALALGGIGMASALAVVVPRHLYRDNIPLRPNLFERGCVFASSEIASCPRERRFRLVPDEDGVIQLVFQFRPGLCELQVGRTDQVRTYPEPGYVRVAARAGEELPVIVRGLVNEACHFSVVMRWERGGAAGEAP